MKGTPGYVICILFCCICLSVQPITAEFTEEMVMHSESLSAEDWFEMGNAFFDNGELNEAIDAWYYAMYLDPELSANAWYNIRLAYEIMGMVIAIDPGNSNYETHQSNTIKAFSGRKYTGAKKPIVPTKTPTIVPTRTPPPCNPCPTEKSTSCNSCPTKEPTKTPTIVPTKEPAKKPIKTPTKWVPPKTHTKKPAKTPNTLAPTKIPTKEPTKWVPTTVPTEVPTTVPTERPTATGTFNDHHYSVFDESMSWYKARDYCANIGEYLATITSQEEQLYIENLLRLGSKEMYWLGGTDEEEEGNWKWITGEPWIYSNWGDGEPNNLIDPSGEAENYLHMISSGNGEWNDLLANGGDGSWGLEYLGFICESGALTPTPVPPTGPFTIISREENGGIVVPKGTWNVAAGEEIIFSFDSSPGYVLANISVNGELLSPTSYISRIADRDYEIVAIGEPRDQVRVDFTADILTGTVPLNVMFTPTSIGEIQPAIWLWNFGNGETIEMNSNTPVSVTYTMPAEYTVSLIGRNGLLSGTETKLRYINVQEK